MSATIAAALRAARARVDFADARALLVHVLGRDPAYLAAHPETLLTPAEERAFRSLIERRVSGEPVAYLVGEREFYGRTFKVSPAVLVPRPETESLVEAALQRIEGDAPARVLDLGTGSGCIALTIASERSRTHVTGVDISPQAIEIANENARALNVCTVRFVLSNWFSALEDEVYDAILANPPYVAENDPHLSRSDLRFEPSVALVAGQDGLAEIRRIAGVAIAHLAHGGWLLFEHGYDQAWQVRELLRTSGFIEIFSAPDLAGIERVTGGRLTGAAKDR